MIGNRKARRKLAKLARKDDKYIEMLATNATSSEIEKGANNLFNDQLAISTEFTLSALILALDRKFGETWDKDTYEEVLTDFREIYAELLMSGEADSYVHLAEDICGQEMRFEFLDDEWDFREIGTPIEMYSNGVWRRGVVIENAVPDESIVTMITKSGQVISREVGSGEFRKPITA